MYPILKRTLDLLVSITLLLLLAPVLAVTSLLVRLRLGSPVLFHQERAGQYGRPFHILKFRTMTDARDAEGRLLPDEIRLTRFGKVLRSYSLDELPQLLNVVLGHMSLVGPRPLYLKYIPRYSDEQKKRLLVLPGITGWAQVNGRNDIDWATRLAQDVCYVEHRSIFLDLKILLLTLRKVLSREGINAQGHVTMKEFNGTEITHD